MPSAFINLRPSMDNFKSTLGPLTGADVRPRTARRNKSSTPGDDPRSRGGARSSARGSSLRLALRGTLCRAPDSGSGASANFHSRKPRQMPLRGGLILVPQTAYRPEKYRPHVPCGVGRGLCQILKESKDCDALLIGIMVFGVIG